MIDPSDSTSGHELPEPIELIVDGLACVVIDLEELEQLLAVKFQIAERIFAAYLALDDGAIVDKLRDSQAAAVKMRKTLDSILESPRLADTLLSDLQATSFSKNCGWRELLVQMLGLGAEYRVAQIYCLAKYRKFLVKRADVLREIVGQYHAAVVFEDQEDAGAKDEITVLEGVSWTAEQSKPVPDLMRLVRGEVTNLSVDRATPLEVWFCDRRFEVECSAAPVLVDPDGGRFPLRDGRNLIGRVFFCDIVVAVEYSDVSRSHAIIDIVDGLPASVTDVSSGGTYISKSRTDLN